MHPTLTRLRLQLELLRDGDAVVAGMRGPHFFSMSMVLERGPRVSRSASASSWEPLGSWSRASCQRRFQGSVRCRTRNRCVGVEGAARPSLRGLLLAAVGRRARSTGSKLAFVTFHLEPIRG
jgi:hypothetical protein